MNGNPKAKGQSRLRPAAKLPLHYEEDDNIISEHVSLKSPSFLAPLSSYNNGASFLESAGLLACPNQEDVVQPLPDTPPVAKPAMSSDNLKELSEKALIHHCCSSHKCFLGNKSNNSLSHRTLLKQEEELLIKAF